MTEQNTGDNSSCSLLEDEIKQLQEECHKFDEQATIAYRNGNLELENKYQKEIDTRKEKVDILKNKLIEIKFKDIDIEAEIEKRRKQHDWSNNERCNNCAMKKSTTFQWKVEGVRVNWDSGFKGTSMEILENMNCKIQEGDSVE